MRRIVIVLEGGCLNGLFVSPEIAENVQVEVFDLDTLDSEEDYTQEEYDAALHGLKAIA